MDAPTGLLIFGERAAIMEPFRTVGGGLLSPLYRDPERIAGPDGFEMRPLLNPVVDLKKRKDRSGLHLSKRRK
jgi:hypothetical protein